MHQTILPQPRLVTSSTYEVQQTDMQLQILIWEYRVDIYSCVKCRIISQLFSRLRTVLTIRTACYNIKNTALLPLGVGTCYVYPREKHCWFS